MVAPGPACIEPEDFAAYVAGMLDDSARGAIEQHVDACADCRALLSALARAMCTAKSSVARRRPLRPSPASMSPTLPVARDDVELPLGARVGRYVLFERLGAGAMGVVYAAHDPELNRSIALKVLRDTAGSAAELASVRDRLRREARAMAQLAHPNVVTVHDVGDVDGHVGIAMELVAGQTLTQWLRAKRRSPREILAAFSEAGRGLAAAHAAGLVHRDFKPDNVLVGDDGRVRVTDFGLAHGGVEAAPIDAVVADAATAGLRTATRDLAGTPYFMAPEQCLGRPTDARADQFSFCVALHAALTGAHPFGPNHVADLIAAVKSGRPRPPPRRNALPRWLRRVVWRGLSIRPEDRHASMDVLLAQLARARRRHVLRGVAAAACVVAVLGGGYAWRAREARIGCRGLERQLDAVWDTGQRDSVARAFRATDAPRWSVVFHEVVQRLDRHAKEWVTLRTDACEAAARGGDPDVLDPRVECLDARLLGLDRVAERLARVDGSTIADAATMTQEVGDLAVCLDADALARMSRAEQAMTPTPVVVIDGAGRLTYLVRRDDGTLWLRQRAEAEPGGWREHLMTDAVAGDPVVLLDRGGQPSYFVRKRDGWLWRGWQRAGEDGTWQITRVAPSVVGRPAAMLDAAERLAYFVRKTDGSLWHGVEEAGGWRERPVAARVAGDPAAVLDRDGTLTYFVRRADGSLWRGWQGPPDGSAWREEKIDDNVAGDPVAAVDVAGKLTSYVRMLDGTLRSLYQIEAGSSVWGYATLTTDVAGNPALTEDAERKQHLWIRKRDGALWHGWQDSPASGPFHDDIVARGIAGDPGVARAADGTHVYVVGLADGSLTVGVAR